MKELDEILQLLNNEELTNKQLGKHLLTSNWTILSQLNVSSLIRVCAKKLNPL